MISWLHSNYIFRRRVRKIAEHLSKLIPANSIVLDVGCGDGSVARLLQDQRPDLQITGLEVLVRPDCQIPAAEFDGRTLPLDAGAVDVVMFIDVLHHAEDPDVLLREADRIARKAVVIKDHTTTGIAGALTLRLMDYIGNARYRVALPYNYWSKAQWHEAFARMGWRIDSWQDRLGIYAWPIKLIFERSLHFVACLTKSQG